MQITCLQRSVVFALAVSTLSLAQPPAAPNWSVITTARIRPEFRAEWEAMQKEITAAYKKGGAPFRVVTQTIMGDLMEYTSIVPLGKWAEMDDPSPIEKALGAPGSQRLLKRAGAYLTGADRVSSLALHDISIETPMADPGQFVAITRYRLVTGKGAEFTEYMKNDYIPAMRKAEIANLWLSQTVFGGDPNERVMIRFMHSLAEIDAGPPSRKALGAEGAARLAAKQNGIIAAARYSIVRVRPDLSAMPPPPKP
ncbi:MAG TPA: hypothetical protein VKG25_23865 [Bryobacteraceae bacterium]|nr:hypothetical protein [Bryobacteraceae bacterium]